MLLLVILMAQLMVVLDTTIVNVALPHIQHTFGFTSSSLSWVINAYILTFGGMLLLGARAGDLMGRRLVFLGGILLFAVSSLAGGIAPDGGVLLAARAVQGVGAAMAAPSALSLLMATFAEGQARMRAIGLYTAVSAAGGATGLVAGGLLTEFLDWRWVMFVNVPIGLLVAAAGHVVIGETERRPGRFDALGALASTAGVSAIVLGLVEAGAYGWGSPLAYLPIALGGGVLAGFVRHESRALEPILPLRLFSSTSRNAANLARGLAYGGMSGMFFFLSQFFQEVQHFTPLASGAAFLPMPASVFAASQVTGRVLVGRARPKTLMALGVATALLGLLLATRVGVSTPYGQVVVPMVLMGAGMGVAFVTLTSAAIADVAPADAGAASGLVNVAQQLGGAFGLAVLVTAFAAITHHAQFGAALSGRSRAYATASLVHGMDDAFALAALFSLAALAMIVFGIRAPRTALDELPSVVPREGEAPWMEREAG